MANIVNPPPNLKLPVAFQENNDQRTYFRQLEWIMFQLWKRTGGGTDDTSNLESAINQFDELSYIGQQLDKNNEIKNIVSTSSSYTASKGDFILATGAITISLNQYPEENEIIQVMRLTDTVTIDGNGKNINGETTLTLNQNYDAPKILYSITTDEWVII